VKRKKERRVWKWAACVWLAILLIFLAGWAIYEGAKPSFAAKADRALREQTKENSEKRTAVQPANARTVDEPKKATGNAKPDATGKENGERRVKTEEAKRADPEKKDSRSGTKNKTDQSENRDGMDRKEGAPPSSKNHDGGSQGGDAAIGGRSIDDPSVVFLTFDDGPSAATPTIVHLLEQYRMNATFFMLEPNMRRFPAAVKAIAEDGFGCGLHGVTHDVHKFYRSPQTAVGEMKTAQSTLKQLTGIHTPLIRVPYGSVPYMTPAERQAEQNAGFIMWDWNVDSHDWDYRDVRFVRETEKQLETMRRKGSRSSPVILLHDRPETAKALPALLEYLKAHGYRTKVIDPSLKPVQFPMKPIAR